MGLRGWLVLVKTVGFCFIPARTSHLCSLEERALGCDGFAVVPAALWTLCWPHGMCCAAVGEAFQNQGGRKQTV